MKKCARIYISGKVHGVYFRESLEKLALKNNLFGWVKNLPDGRVEAVIEGNETDVTNAIAWARQGPPDAKVEKVETNWEEIKNLNIFEIKF